jgi:hypothetical protein
VIRRARVADVPALAALHIRAHDAAYSGYVAAERMAALGSCTRCTSTRR